MRAELEKIKKHIEPLRQEIFHHPVFSKINDLKSMRHFMEHHVFAVWDFMSLLKTLQRNLTCVEVPWKPVGNAETRFLINEIVTGEESDVDEEGNRTSHFELYVKAMNQVKANTSLINQLVNDSHRNDFNLNHYQLHQGPKNFLHFTFDTIHSKKNHAIASVFTFGREDLIPGMFLNFVSDLNKKFPDEISTFKYYLDRHIEIDGEHHSHLAIKMVEELCGDDPLKWEEACSYACSALEKRKMLWDGVLHSL